ncbi:hypothetical protein LguiB_014519 [Lonicera macranthoides]
MQKDGFGKVIFAHFLAVTVIGFIYATVMNYRRRNSKESKPSKYQNLVPLLERTESGRTVTLERFSNYVARQIGLKEAGEYPQLSQLEYEYLTQSKGADDKMYEYFATQPNADSLYVKLVEELDRCILSYFAFHWSQAPLMITQVLSVDSNQKKLKGMLMAATRFKIVAGHNNFVPPGFNLEMSSKYHSIKYPVVNKSPEKLRFERVIKDLKVTNVFSTLMVELKAIGCSDTSKGESECTEVMVPVAHNERSPVLLFMGGGMGAGKSTVLKDILDESFWAGAKEKAVVVEADAFKETDVIYKAIKSIGHHHDMLHTSELVHQTSTDAASSLLVAALNKGRDVIMDGTFSWEPFVEQTVAMARNVHKTPYKMGVGYKVSPDGTITENYWEPVKDERGEELKVETNRRPYRIELVGVVCDAYLAVVRGIRRAIATSRAVRVNSQLKSHKRFASAFERYCRLVDHARLYSTNAVGTSPKLIGWKEGENKLLVDPDEKCLTYVSNLNDEADSVLELYPQSNQLFESGSVWNDIVLSPIRATHQLELKTAIEKIENPTLA